MTDPEVLALLASHKTLGTAPAAEHEWLDAHGSRRTLAVGDILTHKAELATALYVLFSGYIVMRVDRGAGSHKIFERRGGEVSGVLPFSRGARPPNDVIAEEETHLLVIPQEHLAEMIRECPMVTSALVHEMVDRVRQFNASDLHDEKLVSLGKFAAGLAHELNNPTSAAVRSAKLLEESFAEAESAATAMVAANLTASQLAVIDAVRKQGDAPGEAPARTPMQRADEEDALGDRLSDLGATANWAVPLADAGLKTTALDQLAAVMTGRCARRGTAMGHRELHTARSGVRDRDRVVADLRSREQHQRLHVHGPRSGRRTRGRAPRPERHVAHTRRQDAGEVRQDLDRNSRADLPRAHAVGAELNQVWMNLIENALDAVADGGHVQVTAARELDRIVVRVTDNGAGIPADIMGRIFDPFFTTKGVGKGTGLGLDIVRRILKRHDAEINVESRPGFTQFRVTLPVER